MFNLRKRFQSAFHRGTHCYTEEKVGEVINSLGFQSAFHRGTHCY